MVGTFGGALEARKIDASNGKLVAEITGEVETEEGVLIIRRIHVVMPLAAPASSRETIERVHGLYAMSAYAHVRDGTPYPAVLFSTGANGELS